MRRSHVKGFTTSRGEAFYADFKHEEAGIGPKLAKQMIDLLGERE